jgi:orotate phosphoribosyltransferase
MSYQSQKEELRDLLLQKSVCQGRFTLASGAESDFYVDAKLTTMDPKGAYLVGALGWKYITDNASDKIDAVGGLTMGADPIALSIGLAAFAHDPSTKLQTFTVRKKAKEHGRHKLIEGNFSEGDTVVVIDDVITTGGSTLQAIKAIKEAGGRVAFVLALVDRQEGGRQNIEDEGHRVLALFTRGELIGEDGQSQTAAA